MTPEQRRTISGAMTEVQIIADLLCTVGQVEINKSNPIGATMEWFGMEMLEIAERVEGKL
jgi:hypothetical protein